MNNFFKSNIEVDLDIYNESDNIESALLNTAAEANMASASIRTENLQNAINEYSRTINSLGQMNRSNPEQLKGFVAEIHHASTLKINALAKGMPDWKLGAYTEGNLPDASILKPTDEQVDIAIFNRDKPWGKPQRTDNIQSKVNKNPSKTIKDLSEPKYDGVKKLGAAVKDKAIEEKMRNVGISDTIETKVNGKIIKSDAKTESEFLKLAEKSKKGAVQYDKTKEKYSELNKANMGKAVLTGLATGFVLTAVKEIYNVVKNRDNLSEKQFIESIKNILCGTADGGIRAGAIMGSVQVMSKIAGRQIAANSLGAVPVMAAANVAVDFAKDLWKCFVLESIDTDDLLCNTVNNSFSSLAGFGGAYIGGQIGGALIGMKTAAAAGATIGSALGPLGTVIGTVVGGLIFGLGANAIIKTAEKDAYKSFNACITEINSHIELNANAKLYYFADKMATLSEFKLSFKNLLPCYNLISDLKEYNLKKKAIKNIHEQLDENIRKIPAMKAAALRELEEQHQQRCRELVIKFNEQRQFMLNDFKQSINTYIANSYSQFIEINSILDGDIKWLVSRADENISEYNAVLEYSRNRNKTNKMINDTLDELMADKDSSAFLKPFIEKCVQFMQEDKLLIERQYISFEEALYLIGEEKS